MYPIDLDEPVQKILDYDFSLSEGGTIAIPNARMDRYVKIEIICPPQTIPGVELRLLFDSAYTNSWSSRLHGLDGNEQPIKLNQTFLGVFLGLASITGLTSITTMTPQRGGVQAIRTTICTATGGLDYHSAHGARSAPWTDLSVGISYTLAGNITVWQSIFPL